MGRIKRIFQEAIADNITGEAAKVAYYFFLSLFPLILVLFALTGYFGGARAFGWITQQLQGRVPPATANFLAGAIREITSKPNAGALGIGIVLTFWSASGGVSALADGLDIMYDVQEKRGFVEERLISFALLVACVVLLVSGAVAIVAGPAIIRSLGLGVVADVLRWPLAFILVVALFWLLYTFLPNRDQSHARSQVFLGAVVGALAWLAITAGFRFYMSHLGSYSKTYGAVGAVIVLMLWLYLSAICVLFGGEVASVLEVTRERKGGRGGLSGPSERHGEWGKGEDEMRRAA